MYINTNEEKMLVLSNPKSENQRDNIQGGSYLPGNTRIDLAWSPSFIFGMKDEKQTI